MLPFFQKAAPNTKHTPKVALGENRYDRKGNLPIQYKNVSNFNMS